MLTTQTMGAQVGRTVLWTPKGAEVQVPVRIARAVRTYGRIRLLIQPIGGAGEQFVEESRLAL